LRLLDLSGNLLQDLPDSFCLLDALTRLWLNGNPLVGASDVTTDFAIQSGVS
jgi:Leucine-rich repeat (LRR) protein